MEASITNTKTLLSEKIKEFTRLSNSRMRDICKELFGALLVCGHSITISADRLEFINLFTEFLNLLNQNRPNDIEMKIKQITRFAVDVLTFPLTNSGELKEKWMTECLNKGFEKPLKIISYTVGKALVYNIKTFNNFSVIWESVFLKFLQKINLVEKNKENLFAKGFVANEVCRVIRVDFVVPIEVEKIGQFAEKIFGNHKNYKFFKKACSLFEMFSSYRGKNDGIKENFRIKVTITEVPEEAKCREETVHRDREYSIGVSGIDTNGTQQARLDFMVLVGRHPFCDIRLPEDYSLVNSIAFAIFNKDSKYYVLDCSKKSNLKRKTLNTREFVLKPGMVIDIVGHSLILVKSIILNSNDSCDLGLEFISGEKYSELDNGRNLLFLQTEPSLANNECSYLLGKAAFNHKPDIVLSHGGLVSKKHLLFWYRHNKWTIKDPPTPSTNGSFLLLKNYDEHRSRHYSAISRLFPKSKSFCLNEGPLEITILVLSGFFFTFIINKEQS